MLPWARRIDYEDLLKGDLRLIYEHCGEDVLLRLMARLKGMTLYVDARPLRAMQRRYIAESVGELPVKHIAAELGVSQEFVYQTLRKAKPEEGPGLFDEGEAAA